MSLIDCIIVAVVAVLFAAVVLYLRRNGSCTGGCAGCGAKGACRARPGSASGGCPACGGADATARRLGKGVRAPSSRPHVRPK